MAGPTRGPRPVPTPLVLFARLEIAIERGDFQAAAAAQRELARLGVVVRYGLPPAGNRGVPRVF